jgi:hypothetical protein
MSKRALLLFAAAFFATAVAVAALVIYSIRAGVAPVTIPIFALVLGPALAATAMVATCSMVAPPARPQPFMGALEIRSNPIDETAETLR